MSNKRPAVLAAIIIGAMTIFVSANSGPTSWEVSPSSESLTIEEDSPIEVLHETLTFDANSNSTSDYSMTARVTAAYKMHNTSNQTHVSQMAFPFVSSYYDLSDTMDVVVDGMTVPYRIYSGNPIDAGGNPMVS